MEYFFYLCFVFCSCFKIYTVSTETVVSRQTSDHTMYALSNTTSNRTIPTFNTTTTPNYMGSLGVPGYNTRPSSNQSIGILDHGQNNNNMFIKNQSETTIANNKPKHRDQQISMSFSTSTAAFIPLSSAAAYFAKEPTSQPPPILTDIPPSKPISKSKDEYSKPSTINEDQEMTPKKVQSIQSMTQNTYNPIRSPQSPSNFPISDDEIDDEPSNLVPIPDIKRASAKRLARKKLHGRNASQSDTMNILNAAWNIEYNEAMHEMKQERQEIDQDQDQDQDQDPEFTATNEKGMTYVEEGMISYTTFTP